MKKKKFDTQKQNFSTKKKRSKFPDYGRGFQQMIFQEKQRIKSKKKKLSSFSIFQLQSEKSSFLLSELFTTE